MSGPNILAELDQIPEETKRIMSAILDFFAGQMAHGLPEFSRAEIKTSLLRLLRQGRVALIYDREAETVRLEAGEGGS